MSAVEIQTNGEGTEDLEDVFNNSNPDSLEDIPSTMVQSEMLGASKSDVFYDRMIKSANSTKGSPAKSASSAIRRAASVTGAANEDFKQYAVPGHMSPTISSRRRCVNDTTSLVVVTRRKSIKEKEKEKDKDSISLPCTMTRPTPRENRACRKRIEMSHRNHLDFPHEHYHDDHSNHHHHHHHTHSEPNHSHGNNGHSSSNNGSSTSGVAHSHLNSSNSNSNNHSAAGPHYGSHSSTNLSSHNSGNSNHGNHSVRGSSSSNSSNPNPGGSHSSTNLTTPSTSKSSHGYASEVSAEEYLTPLQRKDQVIRGLKEELKKTQKKLTDLSSQMDEARSFNCQLEEAIAEKGAEIEAVKEAKNIEIGRMQEKVKNSMQERSAEEGELREKITEMNDLVRSRDQQAERQLADKRNEILELREKVEELEFNYDELVHVYEESVVNTKAMEKELLALKEELEKREEEHQDMYLAMFQKGKQCHNFERQEELENLGRSDPNTVMVGELITKLENTESQLGHWQTIKTTEIYKDATNRPESEADARLRFLRDSLFHYIMDPINAMQHLKAMAGIVDFTHAQREQVEQMLAQKEKGVVKGVKDKLSEKKKVVQFVFKEKREEVMDRIREHRSRRNSHH